MARMLELSDQDLNRTMINMPRGLMEKEDKMQEQMGIVSREILRKNSDEMLEIKNTLIEMENAFHGLITVNGTTQERI